MRVDPPIIWTIGHSTHPIDEFIAILRAHGIERVVDVRTVPRSAHNPQYDRKTLPGSLAAAGIGYAHMPGLGGLRHTRADSVSGVNGGWRNESFRGYADYMQTDEFEAGLAALIIEAGDKPTAIMCAEAVPWRCHRSLIADALDVRCVQVEHITGRGPTHPHSMTPFARVDGTRITYPPTPEPSKSES